MERTADGAAQSLGRAARLGLILLAALIPAFLVHAQDESPTEPPNRFGAVEAFWLPEAACELGLGWERIIFDWAQHQPDSPEDWNTLNVDDRWLAAAQDCGREVVAVVKHTPVWATDGLPNAGVPRGLYLPVDDPGNVWAAFMRRAAEYYAPRGVNRFIIWNEPDIPAGTYGFIFEGSLDDYFQLLKVASIAARQGNPDARIHVAGTTYWHDVNEGRELYIDRLLDLIMADPEAREHDYYFDALTVHVYFRTDTVYDITRANVDALERHGLRDKEVWIVETNASPNLDPEWPVERPNWQITLEQQSAFLIQAAAIGLAAGADRIAVYKLYDWSLPSGAESFGLIRADQSRRPAFDAWRRVITELGGVEEISFAQVPEANVVWLRSGAEWRTLIAWSRTAAPVEWEIRVVARGRTTPAIVLGSSGQVLPLESADGTFRFVLPGAICNNVDGCAVGGQPVIFRFPELLDTTAIIVGGEGRQLELSPLQPLTPPA